MNKIIILLTLITLNISLVAATPAEEAVTAARKAIASGDAQKAAAFAAAAKDLASTEQTSHVNEYMREILPIIVTSIKLAKVAIPVFMDYIAKGETNEDGVFLKGLASMFRRIVSGNTEGTEKEILDLIKEYDEQAEISCRKSEKRLAAWQREEADRFSK